MVNPQKPPDAQCCIPPGELPRVQKALWNLEETQRVATGLLATDCSPQEVREQMRAQGAAVRAMIKAQEAQAVRNAFLDGMMAERKGWARWNGSVTGLAAGTVIGSIITNLFHPSTIIAALFGRAP